MRELNQYAIIDGASENALIAFLSEHNPPHSCLYAEPLAQDLVAIAPYLVQVTDDVSAWLGKKATPWGIYVSTSVTMKELRQHLRKYLQIIIPVEEKPVFFRFYDPRNVWDFCSILSDWELHCFMGPIARILTVYDGVKREETFNTQRQQFPGTSNGRFKMLRISRSQLDELDNIAADKYIEKMIKLTEFQYGESVSALNPINSENKSYRISIAVTWIYHFCKHHEITDDRSIKGILHLFMERKVYEEKYIPAEWRQHLIDNHLPGYYRAEKLLKNTLGYIPQ